MRALVEVMQTVAVAYLGAGVLFAPWFLARGAAVIDPSVPGSTFGFRIVILPGVVALWPVLLMKWSRAGRGRAAGSDAAADREVEG